MTLEYRLIAGCLSELGELDSELDWCLENNWDSGLPERTPLCTAGCEGFLHLPPLPNSQQTAQYEEPLLVLGIDLCALDNTLEASTIGKAATTITVIMIIPSHSEFLYDDSLLHSMLELTLEYLFLPFIFRTLCTND